MVDLRWDIDWVDEQFDHGLLGYDGYYPMNVGYPLTEKHVELFSSVMPASVMHIWKRFGFDGFGEGRFWFTDPLRWQPVVDAWLAKMELPFPPQKWWCLTRSAMGDMKFWGEISGPALKIDPILGTIRPSATRATRMSDPVMRERMGCSTFDSPSEDIFEDDHTGVLLVDEALKRFGPLTADQIYALVPAYCLTGTMTVDQLSVEDVIAHLVFLAQAQQPRLVEDFSIAVSQAAAAIAANGDTTDNAGDER